RGFFFPMLSMMDILPGLNPRSRMSAKADQAHPRSASRCPRRSNEPPARWLPAAAIRSAYVRYALRGEGDGWLDQSGAQGLDSVGRRTQDSQHSATA
ncbi:hypothetical protein ACFVXE_32095, partial [Streptomyces sp. NPDC058231]|uniref:hypothetical protein n=1 Tax=Streptomyces sp. NPDC058231 TaxID=3346392 RepID=UPI0036E80D02